MDGFYLGPFYVYTWGLTAAIGVLAATFLTEKKIKGSRNGKAEIKMEIDKFWNLAILLIVSVFLGSRILYILETWSYYVSTPFKIFHLWEGGFSFFGGALGGILAGYIWGRINKIDFLYLGWIFTPAWLFGMFFGRLGCFMIHDHLGKVTTLPWSVWVQGAYRHEPALYEAIWLLLVGVGLWMWERKNSQWTVASGQFLFPISLLLYFIGRFFIDFTRADDPLFYSFTLAQWLCMAGIIWAILFFQILAFSRSRNGG